MFQPDFEEVSQAAAVGLDLAANVLRPEPVETSDPKINSPDEFASTLSAAAKTWSDRPVVVMVDELDRCSPEYSVEFLQLLEHVFSTDHVVFIVAINRTELYHSIKSFYGQGFNAEGYLERFFDEIRSLPASNRTQYIGSSFRDNIPLETSSVLLFLDASELSLREIDKSIQVLKSVFDTHSDMNYFLVELWVARTLAPADYRQFLTGDISDKELAEAVFSNGHCTTLRFGVDRLGQDAAQRLEATLVMYSHFMSGGSMRAFGDNTGTKSELFRDYQDIVEENRQSSDETIKYAQGVLDLTSSHAQNLMMMPGGRDVVQVVRLLERELPPE